MAKKGMNIKYKKQKRERNKIDYSSDSDTSSVIKTLIGVIVFLGIGYLLMLGMEALGIFEAGYTPQEKESTVFSYEFIPASTIFNRNEQEYYVLFDNYESNYTKDIYVNELVDKLEKTSVYKVDMSLNENKKYAGEENTKVTGLDNLSVNGVTLIKISNGKVVKYVSGSEKIEEYLK